MRGRRLKDRDRRGGRREKERKRETDRQILTHRLHTESVEKRTR